MRRRTRGTVVSMLTVLALVASAPSVSADDAPVPGDIDIAGGGWGHGIGLSQYGTLGQSLDGRSAEDIVRYYYTGASIDTVSNHLGPSHFLVTDPAPLWISLLRSRRSVDFEAVDGEVTVCHSGRRGCTRRAAPGEQWSFVALGDGTCQLVRDGEPVSNPGVCRGSVQGLSPTGGKVRVDGVGAGRDTFARGAVRIRTPNTGESFHVVLRIGLADYFYGIAEVPLSWPREALEAQAIAARSYGVSRAITYGPESTMPESRRVQCWCHMYSTIADQSYRGWDHEKATFFPDWKRAVDDTTGVILTHPASPYADVVQAFYSSSTGGATQNNEDLWGGSPIPYLRSVPDPWSQSDAVNNPFGRWTFSFSEREVAEGLGLDRVHGMGIVERFVSGTPKRIDIFGQLNGAPVTLQRSGGQMFVALGLRGRHIDSFDYGAIGSTVGDFDGDGSAEAAMLLGWNASWWVGAGGAFAPWHNYAANDGWISIVSGDFDADGTADVAAYRNDRMWRVGLSTGAGFETAEWGSHPDGNWESALVGDFNGDGRDDIADYRADRGRWRVFLSTGSSFVSRLWYDFVAPSPNWTQRAVGDFDGNGYDDIVHLDGDTGALIVLFSDGTGFSPVTWGSLPAGDWTELVTGSFDGNRRTDVAAFDRTSASWWVVRGRKDQGSRPPAIWSTFGKLDRGLTLPVVGDFDADGRDDIATFSKRTRKIKVLESQGDRFRKRLWGTLTGKGSVRQIHRGDTDGDGVDDLVMFAPGRRKLWRAVSNGSSFAVSGWGTLLK